MRRRHSCSAPGGRLRVAKSPGANKKQNRSGIQRKECRRLNFVFDEFLRWIPGLRRGFATLGREHGSGRQTANAHGGRLAGGESPCANKNGSGAREAPKAFRNLKALLLRSAAGALFHLKRYGRFLIPPAGVLHTPSIAPNPAFAPWAVTSLRANDHLRPTPSR